MNRTGTQTLETSRLILRRFREEDAADMYANWASDPEVTRWLTWPAHADIGVSRRVLESWIPRYAEGNYFNWAIVWKESGRVIGNIAVVSLKEEAESGDLGYCLGREWWGRGIMPEAVRAAVDYLFGTAGLRRVAACHDVNNPNSGRVMEKAGMKREGVLRQAGRNNQGICDEVWYAVLNGGGEAAPPRAKAVPAVRFARRDELERVNELRRQVNGLHVKGEPGIFKPGFGAELRDYIYAIWDDPQKEIAVAELDGELCGFAVLNHVSRPENPFMYGRDYLDVDEFGVDEKHRRQGVAGAMIRFIRDWAKEKGFSRLELNMWSFNRGALAFYEAAGFRTYRRYMEMEL